MYIFSQMLFKVSNWMNFAVMSLPGQQNYLMLIIDNIQCKVWSLKKS